jgi:hypothetical protein
VPPVIIDEKTSTDLVVREASNVTLVCKASGYPEPYVMWRREDGEDFSYNGENGMINIFFDPNVASYPYKNVKGCSISRKILIIHDFYKVVHRMYV